MIQFRAITEQNFDAIIRMKRPEEEHFVAPNSVSLAQAWLYRDAGDVFPCAIYNDEEVVGFLLLEEDMDNPSLVIWRIMFPPEYEGKGYGTQAVELVLAYARKANRYDYVELSCNEENRAAMHVYKKVGFYLTGERSYGDLDMRYDLR